MYEQEFQGDVLYIMFYAVVAALNLVACFYLLFRRGNAFAPDITSPIRLRLWTGLFFAFLALSHVWYMPIAFLSSSDDIRLIYFVGGLLDSMTFVPLAIVVLFAMLQDRRRPLWPVAVIVAPLVVIMALCVSSRSDTFFPILYAYFLLFSIGLIIYYGTRGKAIRSLAARQLC